MIVCYKKIKTDQIPRGEGVVRPLEVGQGICPEAWVLYLPHKLHVQNLVKTKKGLKNSGTDCEKMTCMTVLGKKTRKHKEWITADTWTAYQRKEMPKRSNQPAASPSRETGNTVTLLGDEPPSKELESQERTKESTSRS
jgi:hypothetical protein